MTASFSFYRVITEGIQQLIPSGQKSSGNVLIQLVTKYILKYVVHINLKTIIFLLCLIEQDYKYIPSFIYLSIMLPHHHYLTCKRELTLHIVSTNNYRKGHIMQSNNYHIEILIPYLLYVHIYTCYIDTFSPLYTYDKLEITRNFELPYNIRLLFQKTISDLSMQNV